MAINFTDSPSIGNTVTTGNVTWTWNGQTWDGGVSTSVNADTVDGYHATSFALLSSLATSATTDTTNASNISSGTLAAARLATSGVTAATYGNASIIPVYTVDTYGRITSASNTTISISTSAVNGLTTSFQGVNAQYTGTVTLSTLQSSGNIFSTGAYIEKSNIFSAGMAANNSYNINDGVVHYHTGSATANATVNLQGFSSFNTNNTISMVVLNTNGATAYRVTTVQVDGVAANVVKWLGGTAPSSGNSSNIDAYSFSIIKTNTSTYTVLASQAQFG